MFSRGSGRGMRSTMKTKQYVEMLRLVIFSCEGGWRFDLNV
jgi:hypothetical protein